MKMEKDFCNSLEEGPGKRLDPSNMEIVGIDWNNISTCSGSISILSGSDIHRGLPAGPDGPSDRGYTTMPRIRVWAW